MPNAALTRGPQLAGGEAAQQSKGHRGPMAWLAQPSGGANDSWLTGRVFIASVQPIVRELLHAVVSSEHHLLTAQLSLSVANRESVLQ